MSQPIPDYKIIGNRIREIRIRKGMNKTAFSDFVGFNRITLNAYDC